LTYRTGFILDVSSGISSRWALRLETSQNPTLHFLSDSFAARPAKCMEFIDKDEVQRHIWDLMVEEKVATFPLPPYGRIPNFSKAKRTAFFPRELPGYEKARCIFTGPDGVLKPLRDMILSDQKISAYATPHMKEMKMIKPIRKKINMNIQGLIKFGEELKEKVDIVVIGSVAVDEYGNHPGKGAGYGYREIGFLRRKNLLKQNSKIGTLVHSIQILPDLSRFSEPHDIPVAFILTEESLKLCKRQVV
jgi:5-formyltetrahydrofolate cyclo-ligase